MAQRMSSSDGFGWSATKAWPTSIIPGVQNPHCSPCFSLNACWIGLSEPLVLSPSTVLTDRPSACTASIVHDFTGLPSNSTVQAPQLLVSQPTWVPVSPSLRSQWTSSTRGSTSPECETPLTVTLMFTLLPPWPLPPVPGGCRR